MKRATKKSTKKISKAQEIINGYASNGWNDGVCGGKMYNPDFVCAAARELGILDKCREAYIAAFENGKESLADFKASGY